MDVSQALALGFREGGSSSRLAQYSWMGSRTSAPGLAPGVPEGAAGAAGGQNEGGDQEAGQGEQDEFWVLG